MSAADPQVPVTGLPDTSWVRRRTGITTTRPPVHRLSARTVLDESSRPVAAEPPAGVGFGARETAVGRHLVDVHDHYRAELIRLRDVVGQVAAGTAGVGAARSEIATMSLRANAWALGGLCQAQCRMLTEHHTMESTGIFPHLRDRQPDLGPVIDRLDAEHRVIHRLLDEVDAALVAFAGEPGDVSVVSSAVDLLSDTVVSHFAYEESQLVAPLARFGMYPGQV